MSVFAALVRKANVLFTQFALFSLLVAVLPSPLALGATVIHKQSAPFPARTVLHVDESGRLACVSASGEMLRTLLGTEPQTRQGQEPAVTLKHASAHSTFQVTYQGFTPEAQAAFQRAVDIVSTMIASEVPIKVKATFEALANQNTLGSAGPTFVYHGTSEAPAGDFWFVSALADSVQGSDLGDPGTFDIEARFNKNFPKWYFGTDQAPPFEQTDFVQVVMHELLHGLGFISTFKLNEDETGAWGIDSGGSLGVLPLIFDAFFTDGDGKQLIKTSNYANNSAELAEVMISNNVFFVGPHTFAANGGAPLRMYAPTEFKAASSMSHFDEFTFPAGSEDALMSPKQQNGESNHHLGSLTVAAFREMLWQAMDKLYFAQFAAGSGIRSSIVITNRSSAQTAIGSVAFYDYQTGAKLDPAGFITGGNADFTIPPFGEHTFESRNTGSLVLGSVVVSSDQPVSGVVRFAIPGTGVAGVGSGDPVDSAIIPVRRTGKLSTGIAIQNTESDPIRVDLYLQDENGAQVNNGHEILDIPAHGRVAKFLNELFTKASTQSFKGTLVAVASSGKFAAIGLELESGLVFTTLPVATTR